MDAATRSDRRGRAPHSGGSAPRHGDLRRQRLPLPPEVTSAVRRGFAAWQPADRAAFALAAAQLALVAWVVYLGGPYRDDFRLQSMAVEQPLWEWALVSPGSHFAPVPRLLIAAHATWTPWSQPAAATTIVVLVGLQSAACWLLLREAVSLGRPRRGLVAVFAVFLLSPAMVPPAGWWTQAVTLTPSTIGIAVTLLFAVRHGRTGRARDRSLCWLAFLVALLCWEKSLVALPVAAALLVLFTAIGDTVRARWLSVVRLWPLWAGLTGLALAHVAYFLLGPFLRGGDEVGLDAATVVGYLWLTFRAALVPALAGGPWVWDTTSSAHFGVSGVGGIGQTAAVVFVGAVVVLAWRDDRSRTARALLLVLAAWLPGAAMVLVGRVTEFGTAIGRDYRYLPEVILVAVLALGLVSVPPPPATPGGRVPRLPQAAPWLLAAYTVGALVSVVSWGSAWHANPAREYTAQLRAELAARPAALRLYDTDLPADVLDPLFEPYPRLSRALLPLDPHGRLDFAVPNPPAHVVTGDGRLAPGRLRVVGTRQPGPVPRCGYAMDPRRPVAVIPLQRRVPGLAGAFVRVSGLAGVDSRVEVSVASGDGARRVVSPPGGALLTGGLSAVLLRLPGEPVDRVVVRYLEDESRLCVDKASVGVAEPAPEDGA